MTRPRRMLWLLPLVVGCNGQPSPPPADAEPVTVAPVLVAPPPADPPAPKPEPQPPAKPADPAPSLPADAGGKAVAKALVQPPPLPADPPTATKPKKYSSPLDRGELPLPVVKPQSFNASRPSPPPDRGIPDTGMPLLPEGKGSVRPRLKADAPPNPGAADVPMNAWKQPHGERAPLNDPTVDLSAGGVIETKLPTPAMTLPFLRVSIPDPFEWAEHLKGKLGKDTELGTGPIK
jgi:hypothetical protein